MNTQTTSTPRSQCPGVLASLGLAALLLVSAPALAQVLGTASSFAVLAGTPAVTNTGPTAVVGSVGVNPAAAITGFPPGFIVPGTGTFQAANAVALQAQTDNNAARVFLQGLGPAIPAGPALGGLTLVPGIYDAGAATLTGILTLNGPGLYVIRTTSLTTAAGPGASAVVLAGGATPCDVFWTVEGSASLGTFSAFQGNILALTSITLDTSATLQGRALAFNGTVTLASNNITACSGGSTPGFVVPAFFTIASPPTPTLSQWAMIMLAALLAIAGFGAMRRKAR